MKRGGFSIVEAVMAVLIGSIGLMGLNQLLNTAMKTQKRGEANFDLAALKSMMMSSVSCADSLPGGACTAGNILSMIQRTSSTTTRVLASGTGAGTKYGAFTVRAECGASGRGITLRAARLSSTGLLNSTASSAFEVDPYKKVALTWTDPGTLLFDPGVEICGSSVASGTRIAVLPMSCDPIAKSATPTTYNPNNATNRIVVNLTGALPVSVTTGPLTTTSNCTLGISGMATPSATWQSAAFDLNKPTFISWGNIGGKIGQTYTNLAWSPQVMTYYNPANGYLTAWLRDPDDANHDATTASGSDIAFTVTAIQP